MCRTCLNSRSALRSQKLLSVALFCGGANAVSVQPRLLRATSHKAAMSVMLEPADDGFLDMIAFTDPKQLDRFGARQRVDKWIDSLRENRDIDIARMNGTLAFEGANKKYTYQGSRQGVDLEFSGEWGDEWADGEQRESALTFIGKKLDAEVLVAEFVACLAKPEDQTRCCQISTRTLPGACCDTKSATKFMPGAG